MKSYFAGIISLIFPKRHNDNIFFEKRVNKLHVLIENQPHVIHPPNVSLSLSAKINGVLVNKQRHPLQILVGEVKNYMILPIPQEYDLVHELLMEKYVLDIRHLGSTYHNI